MAQKAITVTQLNEYLKNLFAADRSLANVCVTGEISNFKRHTSGHLYFTLKDENAVVSAVMFRTDASRLRFRPESGMKVLVLGRVSIYPKSGQYQIYVSAMQPDGIGSLYMAFEQLKERLYKMGLFDSDAKQQLPRYPDRIALITSPTGAAVRDMIRILRQRWPLCRVLVCPVKVQGEGAAVEVASMIDYVNEHDLADLIIAGRGGGSLEDLWAFNEEIVALSIYNSRIPVISAVGHEPDVTISDYVADRRASTPSNAAEIAVCDRREVESWLRGAAYTLEQALRGRIQAHRRRLEAIAEKPVMTSPYEYFNERRMTLALLEQRAAAAQSRILDRHRRRYLHAAASLEALSPLKVLSRGYSMVTGETGVIKSVEELHRGDLVTITMRDGESTCTVDQVIRKERKK